MTSESTDLQKTPLYALHQSLAARLVPFANYAMPVQYLDGILQEHLHTRAQAGLFDVSHMGQFLLQGPGAAALLETLTPADVIGMTVGQQRYSFFTSAEGGVLDDLMMIRLAETQFLLVVNAACKVKDWAWLSRHLTTVATLQEWHDRALLALQGPQAISVLSRWTSVDWHTWPFMTARYLDIAGIPCLVSRSGYTGEDGVEISVAAAQAVTLAQTLLSAAEVKPIGLGARDSLRLEAGLCLYGHDLTPEITPVEAGLNWAIPKVRRLGGAREGGFPGASVILSQLADPAYLLRKRIGLLGLERIPVREGALLVDSVGQSIGRVTSGGHSPSLGGPIAMAYVEHRGHSQPLLYQSGEILLAQVRDKRVSMRVTTMPFVQHRYFRGV